MAKQAKKKVQEAPVKVKKAKTEKLSKEERVSALYKAEAQTTLQTLRKKGVLSRRQQRMIAYTKGLGGVKGVPLVNTYEVEKKGDKKVVVHKLQQWHRI